MLGELTTPLFSIADFISFEVGHVRAFDTSATSWRMTTHSDRRGCRTLYHS
jgi:hypothetical protein